jgi:hypothetical protein
MQQWRSARTQYLLQILGWAGTAVAVHLLYRPLAHELGIDPLSLFFAATAVAAYFAYFAAAYQTNQLCVPLAAGDSLGGGQPEWYGAPVNGRRILLGVPASAIVQLFPGMLGLALIMLSLGSATSEQLSAQTRTYYGQLTWQMFTMLPHYLLVAACLSLALRGTPFRQLWQPVYAAVAAVHVPACLDLTLQGNRGISEWYWYPFSEWRAFLNLGAIPCVALLLLVLHSLLRSAALHAPSRPTGLYILLCTGAAWLALYQYDLLAANSGWLPDPPILSSWSPSARWFDLMARSLWPSAPGSYIESSLWNTGFGPQRWLVPHSVQFYCWWSLAALVMWWHCALGCLAAARNQGMAAKPDRRL